MAKSTAKRQDGFQSQHIEIGTMKHENPGWTRAHDGEKWAPRYIHPTVNLRESAIVALRAKNAIDECQYGAAELFRRLFEAMGGKGARAIDYSREFVEGGRFPDPIGDHQIDADKRLAAAYEALAKAHGLYAWRLVGYICGEGRSVHELTDTRRQRDTMTDNLRTYLDCLASHWGFASRGVDTRARKVENQPTSRNCK